MVCEKILGKLNSFDVAGKTVDYVDIDWDDAFKKIHRKTTAQGREIGIRMDDSVLTHGLTEGDVLYADDRLVIAVHTPPCEMIRLTIAPDHRTQIAKACYEIGNRHAPLFAGGKRPDFPHALQRTDAAHAQSYSRRQRRESCADT